MSAPIRDALRVRYSAPEWQVFYEVAPETGGGTRYADAVAMNMYQSRGLAVHGFEVKVSRSDWLRELKDPTKSAPVQKYCDAWYVVTPKDIVKLDELPATWGLLELRGTRLHCVVKAPKLDATPMGRAFAACLIRRAGQVDANQVNAAIAREVENARKRFDEQAERRQTAAQSALKQLQDEVAAFEERSGIRIRDTWRRPKLGPALVALFDGWDSLPHRLKDLDQKLAHVRASLAQAVEEFGPVEETTE